MTTTITLKVTRNIFKNAHRGDIKSQFEVTNEKNVYLPEELRHLMGGDEVAFVESQMPDKGKRVWLRRVPDPHW